MPNYRLYDLDTAGHILSAADAVCVDDAEAYALARTRLGPGQRREVWRSREFLGVVTGPLGAHNGAGGNLTWIARECPPQGGLFRPERPQDGAGEAPESP